ncbi:MAG: FAD:protein FMN transferase [Rikenellaceae bacterium]|nr:FAD:protein FMN transferase [Rikenellaceae bacterium]
MKKRRRSLPVWAAFCIAASLGSCGENIKPQPTYYTLDGFALGTTYHIVASLTDTTGFTAAIEETFDRASASMSVYDPNSLLNRLNRNETDSVDANIAACIEIADYVSRLSGGVYDITVKPLTEAWGFTGKDPRARPNLDSLLRYVGYQKIRIENGRLIKDDPAIQIELNSVAKGYIVDMIAGVIAAAGSENFLVEVGGEVFCRGVNRRGNHWVVGIDSPIDGNMIPGLELQTTVSLTGKGLATSGNYRRFYTDAHGNRVVHTINALTGESRPTDILSATVIAQSSALADALGTMLMAVGLEKAIEFLSLHDEILGYLIFDGRDGGYSQWCSPGMEEMVKKQ